VTGSFVIWLVAWAAIAVAVVLVLWRRRSCGLVAAFVGVMALYYWVAAILYVVPWYTPLDNPVVVRLGLEEATYAIAAFAVGAIAVSHFSGRTVRTGATEFAVDGIAASGPIHFARDAHTEAPALPLTYVSIGVVSYIAVETVLHNVPTFTALSSVGSQLVVVGICVGCWYASKRRSRGRLALWLLAAALLPLVTTVTQGFLGYGSVAALVVVAFLFHLYRPRWQGVVVALGVAYLALSLFGTYFGARTAIRQVIWAGAPFEQRITEVGTTLRHFQWFDPGNQTDLSFVDERLDQDALVGDAVSLLSATGAYAHGATIEQAAEALVPRVLWPSKSVVAGSGNLVSQYTGLQFAPGTSVGIGAVMEFYVNYGTMGVLVGFALLGALIAAIDAKAAECLRRSDVPDFALYFLVGISFLEVAGGSLVELTASAGASLVVGLVVNRILLGERRPARRASAPIGRARASDIRTTGLRT
jgi:hypothetical protein